MNTKFKVTGLTRLGTKPEATSSRGRLCRVMPCYVQQGFSQVICTANNRASYGVVYSDLLLKIILNFLA